MANLDRQSIHRIGQAVRRDELQPRNRAPKPLREGKGGDLIMLKVTTALTPMSGATPSQAGRGRIQNLVGASYADESTTAYVIINDTEKTVAVGAYVLCRIGPGGYFHWLTVDKCANLS